MSDLVLKSIDDSRDSLDKARRKELERFAKANGVGDIKQGMPAILMRRILRAKGLTNIQIPKRILGFPEPGSAPPGFEPPVSALPGDLTAGAVQGGDSVDAADDLERQWMEQQNVVQFPEPEPDHPDYSAMKYIDLLKLAKSRNVALKRTDDRPTIEAKLRDQDAA